MPDNSILFADNDAEFLDVRKEFLVRAGYQVLPAYSVAEALSLLEKRRPDLAILDMRLVDDEDDSDYSGIELARSISSSIPTIILTGYPTWQAVREALGAGINNLPAAIEILAKKEGPDMLLRAVNWVLRNPELRRNIVGAFGVPTLMAIPDRIVSLGIEESGRRLHNSLDTTAEQWRTNRAFEASCANRFHFLGLVTSVLAAAIVFISVLLVLLGWVPLPLIPIVVAALTQSVSAFFFVREDQAYNRVEACTSKMDEINKLENLLMICDSLVDENIREKCKQNIIAKFSEHWL